MKSIQIKLISFLVFAFAKAYTTQAQQDFKAHATYMSYSKINIPIDSTLDKKAASDPMIKQMIEQLKKGSKQEYFLNFTRTESLYDEVEELSKPGGPSEGMSIKIVSGNAAHMIYKNLESNTYIKQGNIMGKDFVITDQLPSYEWKLLNETKKIGQYNCFKAIYTPENDPDDQDKSDDTQESNNKITAMIDDRDPTITAWYTPDIPVSNGPGEYHGLPGLIVEVQQFETSILLKEIVLNPEGKLDLSKPKSGKTINQSDFDALQKKKSKEMMERQGNKKGGFIIHSIGG